jgi:small subunit ribosomal protein S6
MRRYETFIILDPDLAADQRAPVIDRVKEIMVQMGGFLIRIDEWGSRKMAYTIRKKERGFYVRFDYGGGGQMVNEMERFFRIDERILKYMTVLTEAQPDLDRIRDEMAKAEAEAQKPAESAPPEAIEPVAAIDEPRPADSTGPAPDAQEA